MVVKGSVSRKSRQTGTVGKWPGNMVCCHQKQKKSRIWLKGRVFAQAKPFQSKEAVYTGCQLASQRRGTALPEARYNPSQTIEMVSSGNEAEEGSANSDSGHIQNENTQEYHQIPFFEF